MVQRSLTAIVKKIEGQLDDVKILFLQKVAQTLVSYSPVDTGAYITSHTITGRSGNGRSRTSHGKPKRQSFGLKASESLSQLMSDIGTLSKDETKTYISNRSPHNKIVEYGGANWRRGGYNTYTRTRAVAPMLLAEAIQEAKR